MLHVSGLDPGEPVLPYLHSDRVYLGSATADAQGTVEFAFGVPSGTAPGEHCIEVRRASGIVSAWMDVTEESNPGGGTDNPGGGTGQPGGGMDEPGGGTVEPASGSGGSGNGTSTGGSSGSGALPGDITTGGQTSSGATPEDGSGSDSSAAAPRNGTGVRSELAASGAERALVVTSVASPVLAWWGAVLVGRSRVRARGGKKS